MAEFITQKENTRRLAVVIICALGIAVSAAVAIYAAKNKGFVEDHPENLNDIKEVTLRVQALRDSNQLLKDNFLSYPKAIGWRLEALGTVDRLPSTALQGETLKSYLSDLVKLPPERAAKGERAVFEQLGIAKYKRWDDPGAGENLTLVRVFDELLAKEKEALAKAEEIKAATEKEKAAEDATKKTIVDQNAAQMKELVGDAQPGQPAAGHVAELIRLHKELNKLQADHSTEVAELEKGAIEKQDEATKTKNENLRKKAASEAVKADFKRRIYAIHHYREEERERREPDGVVVAVDEKLQLAYIDLLRKDRLFKGTKFNAYSLEKGGQKLDKATIEVIEVRENLTSVCSIVRTFDPDWPLKSGDKIYNELYQGGRPRHIAIAGRFTGKLSNEEALKLIREFGDVPQDKVDENTNYVVVADGYEEHPNYKAALEYGIKILREPILYDYLGVRRE
jgi:hypothetical protein